MNLLRLVVFFSLVTVPLISPAYGVPFLLDEERTVGGSGTELFTFTVLTPGNLKATIIDLGTPDPFSTLILKIDGGSLGQTSAAGGMSMFEFVAVAGDHTADVMYTGAGEIPGSGTFRVKIEQVPIPSTFLFFGLGFAGFAAWRYREEKLSKN